MASCDERVLASIVAGFNLYKKEGITHDSEYNETNSLDEETRSCTDLLKLGLHLTGNAKDFVSMKDVQAHMR